MKAKSSTSRRTRRNPVRGISTAGNGYVCDGGDPLTGKQTIIHSFFSSVKRPRITGHTESGAGNAPETPPPSAISSGVDSVPSLETVSSFQESTPPASSDPVNVVSQSSMHAKRTNHRKIEQRKSHMQQMYLDLGQRDFGKQTICKTCGMLFVHGVLEDSKEHAKICQDIVLGVPFQTRSGRIIPTNNTRPGAFVVEVSFDGTGRDVQLFRPYCIQHVGRYSTSH